jgi:hypothetical protein
MKMSTIPTLWHYDSGRDVFSKRPNAGVAESKPTEFDLLALAMLAQPDPTAQFMKKMRGKQGADHRLDY